MPKKILILMGTRPEAIKLAPVFYALKEKNHFFETRICLTGQHQEMLHQAIQHFEITPDYDMKLMKKGQTLFELTASLVSNLDRVLNTCKPDMILVQGDTTTAFVGGLAGYYKQIQVGHVEAGLRTTDKFAPFPEEMNRRLVSVLADHHFAPTHRAKKALLKEGVRESAIIVTGNTVIDALIFTLKKVSEKLPHIPGLEDILVTGRKIVLITGHRRENFGEEFNNICGAIQTLSVEFRDVVFIYPVHLNPNVQGPVYSMLGALPNVYLLPPLGYLPFVRLMSASHIILTDSGGIQEEAPSLGKPVLVMRETTERPEAVDSGTAILVGTKKEEIIEEASRLLTDEIAWEIMSKTENPFGDGKSAHRIVEYIERIS
jgi:UDP-N-acetylglucosamine 2-epimerase (non-hydrolysing)